MDHFERSVEDLRQSIAGLESRMEKRFDAVDRRFESIDQRFSGIDERLLNIDGHLKSHFMWLAGFQMMTLLGILTALIGLATVALPR